MKVQTQGVENHAHSSYTSFPLEDLDHSLELDGEARGRDHQHHNDVDALRQRTCTSRMFEPRWS